MLYVIQHGYNGVQRVEPWNIVYALSKITTFFPKERLDGIDELVKYDDVYSSQWDIETDIDLKRRKEAELLIKNDLPPQFIKGFVVYNEEAKQKMMMMGITTGLA